MKLNCSSAPMNSLPSISIITPTLNAARHLEQTLSSVAAQNYPALEYIVVDGGSTDGTLETICSRNDLISRWVSEPDEGISDAFNKGIRMATGDYIGIINADDYYHPGAFRALSEAIRNYPSADIYFGDAIYERLDSSRSFLCRPSEDVGRHIWSRMPLSHPATFIKRAAYERFGLYGKSYRLAMDYELILRMYLGGASFTYVPHILAHFRYGRDVAVSGLRELREITISHGQNHLSAWVRYIEASLKFKIKLVFGLA